MRVTATLLRSLGAALVCAGLSAYVAGGSSFARSPAGASRAIDMGFNADVAQIEAQLAATASAETEERATQFAYLLYRRAALTGEPVAFQSIQAPVDDALRGFGPSSDLCLLKANVDLRYHRLPEARADLDALPHLPATVRGRALLADVAFQEGRCAEAGAAYESLAREDPSWDNLARLAYFKSRSGDFPAAERAYADAADGVTAKDRRAYAWVLLQHGQMQFGRGRYDEAAALYDRAGRAYPGYGLNDEYTAELLAARRRFDESIALYRRAVARAPRPDLLQALGDVYAFAGKTALARPVYERALAGYLDSVRRGEVQYYHHLAGFYADAVPDPAESLKWARKDAALRPNYTTADAVAWALYRGGRYGEALDASRRALAYDVTDAHALAHAVMIHLAAHHADEARRLLDRAVAFNPRFDDFHVHR